MSKYLVEGHIITPVDPNTLAQHRFMAVSDGQIEAVFDEVPEAYASWTRLQAGDRLIIPGFVDVHLHAPQYANMGLGLDMELLPWLETYTFPEEHRFADESYAECVYTRLVEDLTLKGTTSSVIFGSIYTNTNLLLVDLLRKRGLRAWVGKVNMDRNAPDFYCETTPDSLAETIRFIEGVHQRARDAGEDPAQALVRPIITPRFVPTCSIPLMEGLADLAEKYHLPVQSHLSENRGEMAWVAELHPECDSYLDVYEKYGLLPKDRTVMAHCVWSDEREQDGMIRRGVMVAHAPFSNGNLGSGAAPIANMLERGVRLGLASDISGGNELFMGRVIGQAALTSKFRYAYMEEAQLSTTNLFYMATKGGGSFFGNVGSLEPGYAADFLVINDESLRNRDPHERSVEERLQRFFYNGSEENIEAIFVGGRLVEHRSHVTGV